MSSNQLNDISKVYMEAVYGGSKKENKDTRLVVTNADKKANTKAYQNYKAGNKAYKAADHLKSEGYQRDPEQQEKERKTSKQTDPSKAGFTGIGNSIDDIMKQNAAMKKAAAKKAKKEELEFARHKASVISRGGRLEDAVESWNQKMAHKEAIKNVEEQKEVNVKDTYKTVAAIVDYDRSKKGSKDATYDSMKGDKKAAKKERDYAAFEREKMKKDDPNWKSKKYHTGMHGESYETTKTKEVMGALKKRDLKQDTKKKIAADIVKKKGDTSKSDDRYAYEGKMYGYSGGGLVKKKKKKHDCASKVKHEEYGIGDCIKGMHDLDESGNVAHYDVEFEQYIVENVPVEELEILEASMHEHVIYTEQKKAAKDYDGDGKIESGKDEYFGSKDKAIKKAMGKKVKKESLSDWRTDLSDLVEIVAGPEDRVEKEVKEKKVKNKVVINPKFTEAVEEMGGELLEMEVVNKELKDLKKGAETLKGKNVAKADKVEEGRKPKNCGCGQTPCITYGKENKFNEAMSSYDKARKAAARRAADRNAARRRGEMGGRMERETYTSEGGTRMHHKGYKAREGE